MRDPRPSYARGGQDLLRESLLLVGWLAILAILCVDGGKVKPIDKLDVAVGYRNIYNLKPGGNETICVEWESGSEKGLSYRMTIDDNYTVPSGFSRYLKGKKTACFDMVQDHFTEFGIHDLMVYVDNDAKKEAKKDVYIYYEEEPEGLAVDNETVYVTVGEDVNLTATLQNGTNIKAEWMVSVEDSHLLDFPDVVRQIYHVRNFSEVALHNVSLIVANELTSKVRFFNVCVQYPINGISLQPVEDVIREETSKEIVFKVHIDKNAELPMGKVEAVLSYGDKTKGDKKQVLTGIVVNDGIRNTSLLKELEKDKLGTDVKFGHTYYKQGTYKMNLELISQSNSTFEERTVEIWDELKGVGITYDKGAVRVNQEVKFRIDGNPKNVFHCRIDYGDGTVDEMNEKPFEQKYTELDLKHTYSESGTYTVHLSVYNKMKSHNSTVQVTVCDPIPELYLHPENRKVTTVAGNVNYTLSFGEGKVPSDANCTIKFDSLHTINMLLSKNVFFEHNFTQPGNYNVTLVCSNDVDKKKTKANVIVLAFTVQDFELHSVDLWPMNVSGPTNVSFQLAIEQLKNGAPPEGVTVQWDFGDNITTDSFPLTGWTIEHTYTARGVYNGSVKITHNHVSVVKHFSVRLGLIAMDVNATTVLVNESAIEFTVHFPATLNFQYRVIFGDGSSDLLKGKSSVPHTYTSPGKYRAYVIGWNETVSEEYHLTDEITVDYRIDEGLELDITDKIYFPPGHANVTFTVPEGKPDLEDITCQMSFGDDIDKTMYTFTGDISKLNPHIQNYTYQTLGKHHVTAYCSNLLSNITLNDSIDVINKCFSTDGIFDRQYSSPNTPMMAFTHVVVQIRGRLSLNCSNKGPDYYWEIYKIQNDSRILVPITQSYSDFVRLQEGTMSPGLYEISLNISFTLLDNNWLIEKTYVRYRDPHLISGIDGGAVRVITKKDVLIDAAALSYDPKSGMGEVSGIQFNWKCYWINTESVQDLTARQNQSTTVDCNTITQHVRTGVLMFLGSRQDTKGFVFEVVIKKDQRTSYPARQLVQILKDAPIVKIRCLINCEMKTAVSTDITLESMCESCTETEKAQAKYKWTLKNQTKGSDAYREVPNYLTYFQNTGKNPSSVVIKSHTLAIGGRYRLELEVTVPGKQHPGFASMDLIINFPPLGGTCTVTPTEGYAKETSFVASCAGWKDEGYKMTMADADLQEPKEYSYAIRKDSFFRSIYDHTGASSPKMKFPLSDDPGAKNSTSYLIEIKIVDVMKDYTLVHLPITLKPPRHMTDLIDMAQLNPKDEDAGGFGGLGNLVFGGTSSLEGLDSMMDNLESTMSEIGGMAGGKSSGDVPTGMPQTGEVLNTGNTGAGQSVGQNSAAATVQQSDINTIAGQGTGSDARGMRQSGGTVGQVGGGSGSGQRGGINSGIGQGGIAKEEGGIGQGGIAKEEGGKGQGGTGREEGGIGQGGTGREEGGIGQGGTGREEGRIGQGGTGREEGGIGQGGTGRGQSRGGEVNREMEPGNRLDQRIGEGGRVSQDVGVHQGVGQSGGGNKEIGQGIGVNHGERPVGGVNKGIGQDNGVVQGFGVQPGVKQAAGIDKEILHGFTQSQGTGQGIGTNQESGQNKAGLDEMGKKKSVTGIAQRGEINRGVDGTGTGKVEMTQEGGISQQISRSDRGQGHAGGGQAVRGIRPGGGGRGQGGGGMDQGGGGMDQGGAGRGQVGGGIDHGGGEIGHSGGGMDQGDVGIDQGEGRLGQDPAGGELGGGESGGGGSRLGQGGGQFGRVGDQGMSQNRRGIGNNIGRTGQPAGANIHAGGTKQGIRQQGKQGWKEDTLRAGTSAGFSGHGSQGRHQRLDSKQTGAGGFLGQGSKTNQGHFDSGQRGHEAVLAAKRARVARVRERLLAMNKEDRAAVVAAVIIQKGKKSLEQSKASRNLLRSVNVVSTLASVMNRIPIPDGITLVTKTMKDGQSDNKWDELWDDYNRPKNTLAKKLLARSSENMIDILNSTAEQVKIMNGDQLAALSGSLAMVLQIPEKTSLEAAIRSTDLGLLAAVQLKNLSTQRPYPAKEEVHHGAKGVVSYLGNVLQTTTPDSSLRMPDEITEDTMSTPEDTSDTHYEENLFLMRRNAQANLMKKLKQANATKKVLPKVETAIQNVLKTMESMVVPNQEQLTIKSKALTLSVQKRSPSTINETIRTEEFEATFVAPKSGQNYLEALQDPVIDTVVFKNNPYVNSVDGSSDDITSSVLQLTLKDNETVIDAPLKLKIRTPKPPKGNIYQMKDTMSGPSQMMYHRFLFRNSHDSTFIYVRVPRGVMNVTGYLREGRPPTMKKYDVRVVGILDEWERKEAYKIIIPANSVDNGTVYLALKMTFLPGTILERRKRAARIERGEDFIAFNTSEEVYSELQNGSYAMMIVNDGCRAYNPETGIWDPNVCILSPYSTPEETYCMCDHSPGKSFATTFYVPPNTIDFSLVFTKFDPSNAAVYGLIIGIVVVYIFGLIWARRQDKRDIERWRVGYLVDNLSTDKYFYLLQVHTGLRKNSGTDSRISFVLAGENGDTGVRILSDGTRSLATGSVMNYILAVPRQLSDLSYLRIWHDNSGPGSKASWFLNKIVAEDLQSQQRYIFVCDHWLAVDREDGVIDRVLPVSVKDDFMTFDKLFSEHARLNITDTHLWLSIFMRPERCTFTRVQRVSCCLALLFLMMISSAMFFKSAAEKEDEETIRHEVKIGALRFSMTSFYVSLVGLMVTMPPTILLVMIFKSSKPKPRKGDVNISRAKSLQQQDAGNDVLANRYHNKPLPHFFVYIAWLLLALIVATCGFFLILYSMQWGRDVSEEWLTSFFMCFAQSVVVMDPLKVVILAILLAFCLRDPFDSKGEIDMARVETEARLLGKDELDLLLPPEPLPPDLLAKARRRRRKEVRAQSVFLELIQYIIFLFAIYSLSFGNRDDRSFMIHEHIENNLYTGSVNVDTPFEGIQSYDDFFTWAQSTFIPRLFPEKDIRGSRLPWPKRLFFSDLTNFRVGPARIRQLRMPRHKSPFYGSQYNSLVSNQFYYGAYSLFSEDVNNYCLKWKKMPCSIHEESTHLTSSAWKYTSSSDVWGLPVAGQYKIYSGGGYMLELNVNYDVSMDMLAELYNNSWLDRRTRAVFVEFTLYNAFVNIMAYVRLAAEFPETGSTIIWHDIMTFRLDQHHGSLGAYVLLCEIVIAVILVMFTITLMKKLWEQKLAFFLHVWQTLDLLTVIWCIIAVVFYIIREINAAETLTRFRDNPKKFVNFQHIAVWDNLFIYALGALVFSTTIRILRILGYNKRVTIIAAVLSNSAKDLTGFGIVFGIVFFAYVLSGYILFSAHYYGYHTIYDSMFTIFTYMLGKNIMARLMLIAPIWAQIYFSTLVFFIIFVLLTMFQAIMNNSMTVVRDNLKKVPPPYGLVNVVLNIYRALIRDWLPDSFFKNQQKDVVVMEELRRRPTYQVLSTLRDQLNLAVTVKGAFKRPMGKQFGMDGKMDRGSLEAKLLKTHETKEYGVHEKVKQLNCHLKGRDPGRGDQRKEQGLDKPKGETPKENRDPDMDKGEQKAGEDRSREHGEREKTREYCGQRSRDSSAHGQMKDPEHVRVERTQRRRQRIEQ